MTTPRTFAFAPSSNRFRSAGLAAAGLGGLLVSSGQATIIHITHTSPLPTGTNINFDGVGSSDISTGKKSTPPRFDHFASSAQTGQVVVFSGDSGALDQLPANTLISSASSWSVITGTTTNTAFYAAGDWTIGDTGYFGFSFRDASSNIYYGWGVASYTGVNLASVSEWAYNDVAGAPILAGQLVAAPVPEPATTALLAGVVILSGTVWLRKRQRSKAGDARSVALDSV